MTTRRVLFFFTIIWIVALGSSIAIRFARGDRFDPSTGSLKTTGLLVATSDPDGASVYLDGKLKTATDDTLNLPPGQYEVEIKLDGYHSWKKTLLLEKELVTQAEASLFSSFPSLKSLTRTGAANPLISPDGQKVVFAVASSSAEKKGLWVLDLVSSPLNFSHEPRQIIQTTKSHDFSQATYRWSPDSKQILLTLNHASNLKKQLLTENFILETDRLNDPDDLVDISLNLETFLSQWEKEDLLRREEKLSKLPKELTAILRHAAADLNFSPNDKKVFYTATASASLKENFITPLPASNTQPETRILSPGQTYVYDLIEDKNFLLSLPKDATSLSWLATNRHLFLVRPNKITVLEYDNTNWLDVYTGNFENGFAFPFPSGDRAVILTSLGENQPSNLYEIGLK